MELQVIAKPIPSRFTFHVLRADLRNLGLLLLGFVCLLVAVPPVRAFPITDDWTYVRSVPRLLSLAYVPDEAAQATALGHIAWGALFSALVGQSFTVLTLANLVMGMAGVAVFYLLLRRLNVVPAYALLGAALLGLNPIYVYLSYTFMTDVTFLVYVLAGCLCYVIAMQEQREKWLWLGSIGAALAYLTRQYGILLVPAAVLYLWWSGQWTWRKLAAIAAIPVLALAAYTLWERGQPKTLAAILASDVTSYILQHPFEYAIARLQHDAWMLYTLGLFLLPVLRLPRRPLLAAPVLAFLMMFLVLTIRQYGSAFPQTGDVIDHTGFVMFDYYAAPLWSEGVWALLALIGSLSFSLYLAYIAERSWAWLRSGGLRSRAADPALLLYLLGAMLAAVVLVLTPYVFDRYALTILPILLLPLIRVGRAEATTSSLLPSAFCLLPLALFAVLGERDYMAHASARWQAAEGLAAQGVARDKIDAGFEWAEWYLFDEGLSRMRQTGDYTHAGYAAKAVLDPLYLVSDLPVPGYTELTTVPYQSWLSGGETRHVRVMRRSLPGGMQVSPKGGAGAGVWGCLRGCRDLPAGGLGVSTK